MDRVFPRQKVVNACMGAVFPRLKAGNAYLGAALSKAAVDLKSTAAMILGFTPEAPVF